MEASGSPESYLTVAEVAELLKLNQQTVRNWIDQGSLPALRVGRRVRIKRSDLDKVLEAGSTVGGGSGGPSGEDFWGGRVVGVADPDPDAQASDAALAAGSPDDPPADGSRTPPANGNGNGTQT
jgi:excisionase family DNA binding protein